MYLGIQRTDGGRPLILKCLPSNWEHCSSRKSLRPRGHGSVLQERNFILRPTQNLPPFLGLPSERGVSAQFQKWNQRATRVFFGSYSGLLQSLLVLRVPPPQDLEQTL